MKRVAGIGFALALCLTGLARAQQLPELKYAALGDLKLESGQSIHNCKLAYRTFGSLGPDKSNAILFPMWFTGRSGDVSAYIGHAQLIDDAKYFVIVVDPIGNGVSCSPSNSTAQHGPDFPAYTIRDMVSSEYRLLTEQLHITHLHAVMGVSMGGMQTFEWVADHPEMMDLAVPIVGSPQLSSYDLLLWTAEADALKADPEFHGGRYTVRPKMPMVAYLHSMNLATPEFRAEHTTREQFPQFFHQLATEANNGSDANDYLSQLSAMIHHDIGHGDGSEQSLYQVAPRIKAKMLIVNARQDHMVNPLPALGFAKLIHAQTIVLESDCGHLAPGCELATLAPQVDRFLATK